MKVKSWYGELFHKNNDYRECSTKQEVMTHADYWTKLMSLTLEDVSRESGCEMPCSYISYAKTQLEYQPDIMGGVGIVLGFSSNKMIIKDEKRVYPLESFVAEVGGSLGLFLGFSFLGCYDFIVPFILKLLTKVFRN